MRRVLLTLIAALVVTAGALWLAHASNEDTERRKALDELEHRNAAPLAANPPASR